VPQIGGSQPERGSAAAENGRAAPWNLTLQEIPSGSTPSWPLRRREPLEEWIPGRQRRVHERYPLARLRMVGNGPLLDACRDLARGLGVVNAMSREWRRG
jgi:hypothetical protein